MITVRRSGERGHFDHGWLKTFHTFSFAEYHDPEFMGFRALRVINEDWVAPGQGFGTHPHRDMEIITYILQGELQHKDSMGNGSVIRPGQIQYMSAGTGVTHSEFNPSSKEPVHLLQIWILTAEKGAKPRYAQESFDAELRPNVLKRIVSPDGAEGTIAIRQDANVYVCKLGKGAQTEFKFSSGRYGWLQLAKGAVAVNEHGLTAGDGAAIGDESQISLKASSDSEFLLFDLA